MRKKVLYIVMGLVLLLGGGYFYVNYLVKSKVESFLTDQLSPEVDLKYGELYMSTFSGTISIEGIDISIKNQQDTVVHTTATVDKLSLFGFNYWNFFVSNKIQFDRIDIDKNNIVYFKDKFVAASKTDTIKQNPLAKIDKSVLIKAVEIGNTSFTIYDKTKDSVLLHVSKAAFSAKNIRTDSTLIRKRIPVIYSNVNLETDSLFVKISPYEGLRVKNLKLVDKDIQFQDLSITPNYGKAQYSQLIPVERDYTTLKIPAVQIMGYDFGFNGSNLFANAKQVNLERPDLSIYRDKLVRDDTSFKPLYSKMLRDLSLELMIDSIVISKCHILYEEKIKVDQPAGSIEFSDLDVILAGVGNTQPKGKLTTVTADGYFQGSKLHVDWSFDVHDTNDAFRFSGRIGELPASNIDSFTRPNLDMGFEGSIDEVYFDISGNNNTSQTSMKMAYEDFKIDVMRKEGFVINKLLSGIANIFVAKNSRNEDDIYREGQGDADRNKSQSVFNFVWISLLSALLKTMT